MHKLIQLVFKLQTTMGQNYEERIKVSLKKIKYKESFFHMKHCLFLQTLLWSNSIESSESEARKVVTEYENSVVIK